MIAPKNANSNWYVFLFLKI